LRATLLGLVNEFVPQLQGERTALGGDALKLETPAGWRKRF
jgi:hypothetical protein